jgi:hypothetical protein
MIPNISPVHIVESNMVVWVCMVIIIVTLIAKGAQQEHQRNNTTK